MVDSTEAEECYTASDTDGRKEDLLIISQWVRKELFVNVKFLYQPDKDLAVNGQERLMDPLTSQSAIGWRLFTRGFLTRKWRDLLGRSTPSGQCQPPESDITKTIAGIIKTMWGALGRAWLDHLDTIHQKSKSATEYD
jgi:hypothetical protein